MTPNKTTLLLAAATLVFVGLAVATPMATADSVSENVTLLQNGIISTIATWVPFVVLFTLLGLAMSAIGIHLFQHR